MDTQTNKYNTKIKTQTALPSQSLNRHRQSLELLDMNPSEKTPSQQQNNSQQLSSLFQTELYNHNLRKQVQKYHNKSILEFYKRKKNMVKFMNKQQIRKKKQAQQNNKVYQCSKYMNTHLGYFEGSRPYIRSTVNQCRTYNHSVNVPGKQNGYLNKNSSFFQNARVNQGHQNRNNGISHRTNNNIPLFQQTRPNAISSNICKRQVYLSNISNIDQLKKSLSYSKARFHRKIIKMERQIGNTYIPFQDKLPGGQNCVKGIFM